MAVGERVADLGSGVGNIVPSRDGSTPFEHFAPACRAPHSRMRIALIIERFDPAGGGVEAAAWQVAQGLAKAGEEIHVFARRVDPPQQPRSAAEAS